MAITVNGTATTAISATSCSAPGSIVAGELLVAWVLTVNVASDVTGPSGWTRQRKQTTTNTANGLGAEVYWFTKVATGSEPGSYTFTFSGGASNGDIAIFRLGGQDWSAPVGTNAGASWGGGASSAGPWANAGLTTAVVNNGVCFGWGDWWTPGPTSGETYTSPLAEIVMFDAGANYVAFGTFGSAGATGSKNLGGTASAFGPGTISLEINNADLTLVTELHGRPFGLHGQVQMQQLLAQ